MWDVLLSAGQRLYGIAVDDAHVFKRIGQEFANPGRGWICVRAESLSAATSSQRLRGSILCKFGRAGVGYSGFEQEYSVEASPATPKNLRLLHRRWWRVLAKSQERLQNIASAEAKVRTRAG